MSYLHVYVEDCLLLSQTDRIFLKATQSCHTLSRSAVKRLTFSPPHSHKCAMINSSSPQIGHRLPEAAFDQGLHSLSQPQALCYITSYKTALICILSNFRFVPMFKACELQATFVKLAPKELIIDPLT